MARDDALVIRAIRENAHPLTGSREDHDVLMDVNALPFLGVARDAGDRLPRNANEW